MNEKLPMSRRSGALALGDLKIPGYKLENGRRLVVQRETLVAFGKSPSKGGAGHVAELERFFSTNTLKPYADNVLPHVAEPIEFTTPAGGRYVGYDVKVLLEGALAIDNADRAGALGARYAKVKVAARVLLRALAGVGLDVLFDEAVGDATTNHSADFRQYVEEAIAAERKAWAGELSKRDGEIADLKNALALKDDVEIDLVGFAVFGKSAAGRAMREAQLLPERTKDTIRLRKAEAQERRDARRGQKYIFTLRRAAGGAA